MAHIRVSPALVAAMLMASPVWATQPNVLIVMADDLGVADVSYSGLAGRIRTPNIDALASRGMVFDQAQSAAAVCTPTRNAVLTGQHLHRTWLGHGIINPYGSPVIEPGTWAWPRFMQRAGYYTTMIGKGHLGTRWRLKDGTPGPWRNRENDWQQFDFTLPYAWGPLDWGFDHYFGLDAPNWPPYAWVKNRRIQGRLTAWKGLGQYGREGLAVPGWRVDQVFGRLSREMVAEVGRLARRKQPFFAYFPLTGPHTPITPNRRHQGTTPCGPYCDFVAEIDTLVGSLTRALRAAGELDDTIIVFTSDNGSPERYDHDSRPGSIIDRTGHRPNGELRGRKASPYEGGLRIPLVISWPAGGKVGRTDRPVSLTDISATVIELIGESLRSPDAAPDASSFASEVSDDARDTRRRLEARGNYGESLYGKQTVRWNHWKIIRDDPDTIRLYNLRRDPSERRDVAKRRPEVLRMMQGKLEAWMD